MDDYTALSKMIIAGYKKTDEPLTEIQENFLIGCLAGFFISVETIGLSKSLENLNKRFKD